MPECNFTYVDELGRPVPEPSWVYALRAEPPRAAPSHIDWEPEATRPDGLTYCTDPDCQECRDQRYSEWLATEVATIRDSLRAQPERNASLPNLRSNYYQSIAREKFDPSFNPSLRIVNGMQAADLSTSLRQVFAFMRRHDDGRYSANSKMRLLTFADKVDDVLANGDDYDSNELPIVVLAETPFTFDEETEVKSGGLVGAAVIFPDGRSLLAVHQQKRRCRVGQAMYNVMASTLDSEYVMWVHRTNQPGQHFAISMGMYPYQVNSSGAVQYARWAPQEETDAVEFCDQAEVDRALRFQLRAARPRRQPSLSNVY